MKICRSLKDRLDKLAKRLAYFSFLKTRFKNERGFKETAGSFY
jgi:hypothetical protein